MKILNTCCFFSEKSLKIIDIYQKIWDNKFIINKAEREKWRIN